MFDRLSEWLAECEADVVCFQEVSRTPGLTGWTHFDDGVRALPQRANLFADLIAFLPNHQGSFVSSDAGPISAPDGSVHTQDFGIAMFVHERLPIIGTHTAFVHGTFIDHEQWTTTDRPRIAQASRIVDRDGGRNVAVVHLHGLRDPVGKHDTPARVAQAHRLAEVVATVRQRDDFVVVCGDLNLLPDSETFSILAAVGLVDLVGTSDTRTSLYPKANRHANYLLVSAPEGVKRFEAPPSPEVSDHRFMVLEI